MLPLTFLRQGSDLGGATTRAHLVGALDEVRVYSRALSAAEIAGLLAPAKLRTYAYGLDPLRVDSG